MNHETITLPRSVVEQALEALEFSETPSHRTQYEVEVSASIALRAALGQPPVEQEPVTRNGWVLREILFDNGEPVGHREPQPPRQPLTDDEVWGIWNKCAPELAEFARAIERAHGIGGEV